MSNRKELRDARRKAREADELLYQIMQLPRRVGSLVQWGENGVVWRRLGDDMWEPLHANEGFRSRPEYGVFPSSHVADTWQGWTQTKQLPVGVENP